MWIWIGRDNCDLKAAKHFRLNYKRPYYLPPMAEAAKMSTFFVAKGKSDDAVPVCYFSFKIFYFALLFLLKPCLRDPMPLVSYIFFKFSWFKPHISYFYPHFVGLWTIFDVLVWRSCKHLLMFEHFGFKFHFRQSFIWYSYLV